MGQAFVVLSNIYSKYSLIHVNHDNRKMLRTHYVILHQKWKKNHLRRWWVTVVTDTVSMAFIPTATVARLSASLKLVFIRVTTPEQELNICKTLMTCDQINKKMTFKVIWFQRYFKNDKLSHFDVYHCCPFSIYFLLPTKKIVLRHVRAERQNGDECSLKRLDNCGIHLKICSK